MWTAATGFHVALSLLALSCTSSAQAPHHCLLHQQKARQTTSKSVGDQFVPRCKSNGVDYDELQCIGSVCTCSHHDGTMITGWNSEVKNCHCLVTRDTILTHGLHIATYIPKCTENGEYEKKQCDQESCWSVDPKTGVTRPTDMTQYRRKSPPPKRHLKRARRPQVEARKAKPAEEDNEDSDELLPEDDTSRTVSQGEDKSPQDSEEASSEASESPESSEISTEEPERKKNRRKTAKKKPKRKHYKKAKIQASLRLPGEDAMERKSGKKSPKILRGLSAALKSVKEKLTTAVPDLESTEEPNNDSEEVDEYDDDSTSSEEEE